MKEHERQRSNGPIAHETPGHREARLTHVLVAATCLPTVVGTTVMAMLALEQQGRLAELPILGSMVGALWVPAFIGAAYGWVLVPLGAAVLARAHRRKVAGVGWGWAWLAAALAALAAWFHWVVVHIELP